MFFLLYKVGCFSIPALKIEYTVWIIHLTVYQILFIIYCNQTKIDAQNISENDMVEFLSMSSYQP